MIICSPPFSFPIMTTSEQKKRAGTTKALKFKEETNNMENFIRCRGYIQKHRIMSIIQGISKNVSRSMNI